jgi:hypothetical protein
LFASANENSLEAENGKPAGMSATTQSIVNLVEISRNHNSPNRKVGRDSKKRPALENTMSSQTLVPGSEVSALSDAAAHPTAKRAKRGAKVGLSEKASIAADPLDRLSTPAFNRADGMASKSGNQAASDDSDSHTEQVGLSILDGGNSTDLSGVSIVADSAPDSMEDWSVAGGESMPETEENESPNADSSNILESAGDDGTPAGSSGDAQHPMRRRRLKTPEGNGCERH